MNGTPRLRSAYPSTPPTNLFRKNDPTSYGAASVAAASDPTGSKPSGDPNAPWVPFEILDAPTQRLYISVIYVALSAWKFYDYHQLVSEETDSLWLFMKWVVMDGVFLLGLPGLRIPWLEWSSTTTTVAFLVHAILNAFLMFRIPLPIGTWFIGFVKLYFYNRELAISERRVDPSTIRHNASLILGKQIVHILPEGSAMLNPYQSALCIDGLKPSVDLPIRVNQTSPILIEILRIDLDTNEAETIVIPNREARRLKKQADQAFGKNDVESPRLMRYPVRKTGLYRLSKVVDESKLEVQRRLSDTLVVQCPSASIKSVSQDRCKGTLSDFLIEVDATPPLKIKYTKVINREDQGFTFLSIHPENLFSPLAQSRTSGALVSISAEQEIDVSWARTQHIRIPINETLGIPGGWQYSIDEIHDACGNVANYSRPEEQRIQNTKDRLHTDQIFTVHERPKIALSGCTPENPLKIAKGKNARLPIVIGSTSSGTVTSEHLVSWAFTPQDRVSSAGEHETDVTLLNATIKDSHGPVIRKPGLYALQSVSTEFCAGEVLEPSSCLLLSPPEPDLTIAAQNIPDKCAGNSVGLMVDLDLVGTPPFRLSYTVKRKGGRVMPRVEKIEGLRTQLMLTPYEAGHYTYEFLDISDAVYELRSLKSKNLRLEQDVKPSAWAKFLDPFPTQAACIGESTSFALHLSGEPPWSLEYEIVRGTKKRKFTIENLQSEYYTLWTEKLTEGGEHSLSLTSVSDISGCKAFLEQEAKIQVRHQRPKASFGYLDGKRSTLTLEARKVNLPVRLTGEAPWTINYRKVTDPIDLRQKKLLQNKNDVLEAPAQGIYEIIDVKDAFCPGTVESSASRFEVSWIPRPSIRVAESSSIEVQEDRYVKKAVCEEDQDSLEVLLTGNPPYHVKYEVHLTPERGPASLSTKELTAGLGGSFVRMETSQAGLHEYKFAELVDNLYDHDRRKFSPVTVQQRVFSRPSARFDNSGKTYSYCKEEQAGVESIPIILAGVAPFALEIGIKHHATSRPEIVNVPHVDTHRHSFHIPHRALGLGIHSVTIRKVRDSHGCQRETEFDGPTVYVNVADLPAISPLESATDYCVGDRISYTLAGTPPFNIYYAFQGIDRKAKVSTTEFKRIAESPGNFTITALSDKASSDSCRARTRITKVIHQLPSVRISKGKTAQVDIHEGGEAEILFEFGGTPPFEFTYTRSTNAGKGKKSVVIETRHDTSYEYAKLVKASEEGTYEVVSIKDRYCGFSTQIVQGRRDQQLLTFR